MTSEGPPAARRTRLVIVAIAATFLVVAGVLIGAQMMNSGDTTPPAKTGLEQAAASLAALPKCGDVFVPGKPIDGAVAVGGCRTAGGGIQVVGYHDCTDGKRLWQVDAGLGAPAGYGRDGQPYIAQATTDSATDPGYGEAYKACRS